jgi:hypothetical protein
MGHRIQHTLHQTPSLVPLIVLLVDHRLRDPARIEILLALCPDPDPAAGSDRRYSGGGAEPGHPDGRHRSFRRRHRGAVLGGHGPVHLPLWHARSACDRLRPPRGTLIGYINGWLVAGQAAALHRHARHVADRAGDQLPLFGQRDHPLAGNRGARRSCSSSATRSSRRRDLHLWRHLHGAAVLLLAYVLGRLPGGGMSTRWATIRKPRSFRAFRSRKPSSRSTCSPA